MGFNYTYSCAINIKLLIVAFLIVYLLSKYGFRNKFDFDLYIFISVLMTYIILKSIIEPSIRKYEYFDNEEKDIETEDSEDDLIKDAKKLIKKKTKEIDDLDKGLESNNKKINKKPTNYNRQYDTGLKEPMSNSNDESNDESNDGSNGKSERTESELRDMRMELEDIKKYLTREKEINQNEKLDGVRVYARNSNISQQRDRANPYGGKAIYDDHSGWNIMAPKTWGVPQRHPPVCISDNQDKCPTCPTYSVNKPYSNYMSEKEWAIKSIKDENDIWTRAYT